MGLMNVLDFQKMKAWIGFTNADAAHLQELGPPLAAELGRVVDRFYDRLMQDEQARSVFQDDRQLVRLRHTLQEWLRELFGGEYEQAYLEKRNEIGRTHVRVGLPQRFMFTAMNVIRQELSLLIVEQRLPEGRAKTQALNRLLDLELAIMLETYRESYIQKTRAADRIVMQQQLDEVKHMAEIGQLAASLAHEIKNPLAGISGAIQIISREMDAADPHLEIMREILRQIDRLDSAVKDLLVYARPKPPELRTQDVGVTIQNCLALLSGDPELKSLRIECDGLERRISARIDSAQFEQVITNLMLNAAQACDGRGRVNITLSTDSSHVVLRIRDNGRGMSEEVRQRALEPFFTTEARGTGLGLSICKKIIDTHHGEIRIETTMNGGTTVSIILPQAFDGPRQDEEKDA